MSKHDKGKAIIENITEKKEKNIFLLFISSTVLGIIVTLLTITDKRFYLFSIVLLTVSTILALIIISHTREI